MTDKSNDTSRRDFIKTSSVAAAGASLLGNFSQARAFADGDETIKVGLIGVGGRGSGAVAQALSTDGPVILTAVADAFVDRLEEGLSGIKAGLGANADRVQVDQDHKFVGFGAYQQVINSDIDLVILTTPPGFRPIHFDAAVKAGKHVFMEKPVATDAPGIRSVLENAKIAKQKGLAVGVGLQRHHQPKYIDTVKRIHDGEIGDIIALRVYWNSAGVWDPRRTREECKTEMEYQMRNWYYYTWLCGDHICEQHIHNLDVGNWVKGQLPVRAWGMGGRQVRTDKKYGEIFDHFAVEYEYPDGTRMFSQCRHIPNTWRPVSEHAHGTKGTSDISGGKITVGDETWRWKGNKKTPYQIEHDDLFAAIRAGKAAEYNEAEYGATSTMTAILGRMATYSGKPIEWDAAINSEKSLMPAQFSYIADPPTMPNENGEYPIPVPGVTNVL